MSKHFILTLVSLIVIGTIAAVAIFLTKGYTFSPKEGLVGTGIISVASLPDGASVYIDGHLTTATNTNISNLAPKTYKLKIVKEGFIPWEKEIKVSQGLVSEVKATLFPSLPTIYPLTVNGAENPVLSPDGQKLAFAVPFNGDSNRQRGGIWVWTMSSQPISFARGAEPHQVVVSTTGLDFAKASVQWSPDSTEVLVTLQEGGLEGEANQRNFLLPINRQTALGDLKDITPVVNGTLKGWEDDQRAKDETRIATVKNLAIRNIASGAAILKWSPDETRFLIEDPKAKTYNLENNNEYNLPEALTYQWLPDSQHVILVGEDKVSITEFDGGNVAEVYAGKFEDSFVFPWPDSSRLVILTSFNTQTASRPNLFGINLK